MIPQPPSCPPCLLTKTLTKLPALKKTQLQRINNKPRHWVGNKPREKKKNKTLRLFHFIGK